MPALTVLLLAGSDVADTLLTVRDLCAQSFRDFELLVLDDGAAPMSGAAVDWDCDDRRVRLVRLEAGGAAGLNRGLEMAQGELVVRVAAGDASAPDRFARQVGVLGTAQELAFVVTGWRSAASDGQTGRRASPPAADAGLRLAMSTGDAVGHPVAMMRREAVMKVGGWRPAFVGMEDYDLLLRLLDRHRGASIPEALVEFKAPSTVPSWQALEQSILSEMAAVAAYDRRQVGRPDHGERTTPADRTMLHRMGMAEEEVAHAIIGRAWSAATVSGAAGQWRAMREAARLGLRQDSLPGDMKSRFVGLWLRSLARLRPGGMTGRLGVGGVSGVSADPG